ncbi:MAG: thiamine diphosphokinase [Gammaproteobacteria bacterium]
MITQAKTIVILEGEVPPSEELQVFSELPFIAADAAAWSLIDRGLHPQVIVGDMDSLYSVGEHRKQDPKIIFKHSTWVEIKNQDTTDFEKTLNYAVDHQLSPLLILGLFGKEIDHSLYNLSHLVSYSGKLNLMGLHVLPNGKKQWVLPLCKSETLQVPAGTQLSVIPMPLMTLTAPTLKWPLDRQAFDLTAFHVRNKTTLDYTDLVVEAGQGLIIVNADLPPVF